MPVLRFLWLALLLLAGAAHAQQLLPVPELTGRVNDNAAMLSAQQRQQLEAVLADYEQQTGNQIAILTVDKTEPEAIEQYGIRVVEAWQLGRKGIDDGVLLLVAKDNPRSLRRLRIEAGRGVQGVLTDAQSKRILEDVIAPHFRQGEFYDGMVAGVSAIAALLAQEKLPAPQRQQARQAEGEGSWWPFVLFGVLVLMSMMRPRHRRSLSRGGWGAGTTGFILGNAIGGMMRGGGSHGGFGGGGFGGFSGGGGTFDGGGASGDW